MSGSRLLPAEQRRALPAAPTTSRWWRSHVLLRSWLNRHHRWLAPALVCAPPVGVAMLWAGATRPGRSRRWVTAGAAAWTLALVLAVVALTLPGAQPADAGAVPSAVAGGPALATTSAAAPRPSPTASREAAAASVARQPAAGPGVGAAHMDTTSPADDSTPTRSSAPAAGTTSGGDVSTAPRTGAPASSAPVTRNPAPTPTRAKPTPAPPTPRRTPVTPPRTTPKPPAIPTATPFTACTQEGAVAISPHGLSLRCFRTPIGLYWLWH